MAYELWIPGRPRTKGRPKFGKGRTYTPKATEAAEKLIADAYAADGGPTWDGPVAICIDYYPEGQLIQIEDLDRTSPLTGDVDNYAKLTLDALQKAGAFNDKMVMSLWVDKYAKES